MPCLAINNAAVDQVIDGSESERQWARRRVEGGDELVEEDGVLETGRGWLGRSSPSGERWERSMKKDSERRVSWSFWSSELARMVGCCF
jgi:hypothetical protein